MTIPKDQISERVLATREFKVSGAIHLTGSMPPGLSPSIAWLIFIWPVTSKEVWGDISGSLGPVLRDNKYLREPEIL